jgi:hypothetical protein
MAGRDAATSQQTLMPFRQRSLPEMHTARKLFAAPSLDTVAPEEIMAWVSPRAPQQQALRATKARNASGRRRMIDPTTCERDYSAAELEFMQAMQDYKQQSGRMFPTWSEVLEVVQDLGYRKEA